MEHGNDIHQICLKKKNEPSPTDLKQHMEAVNENVEVKEMWKVVEVWVLSNLGEFSGRRQL